MSPRWLSCVAVSFVLILTGCHSSGDSSTSSSSEAANQAVKRPIPPDSPFARIKEGMGYDEVVATIGQPTSPPHTYMTGKSFIPFHYGGDNSRMAAHYKGLGIIVFSQDHDFTTRHSVMSIDYDPDEPGYEK